jgi:rRNA processing protein Krr1/Pno1
MSFELLIDRKQLRIKIDKNKQQYYKQYQMSIKKRIYNSTRMQINDSFNQRKLEIMKT